jgi:hypothetical protein
MYKPVKLENYTQQLDAVSMELSVSDVTYFLENSFTSFITSTKSFFQGFVKDSPTFGFVKVDPMVNLLVDNKIGFSNAGNLKIYTPPGMSVQYLEWIRELDLMTDAIIDVNERLLLPFVNNLAGMVNIDKSFTSRRSAQTHDVNYINLDHYEKVLKKITRKNNATDQKMKNVVSRIADWKEVETKINDVVEKMSRVKLKEVHANCERIAQHLDTILDLVQDEDVRKSILESNRHLFNKDVVRELSTMTHDAAREVEFLSVVFYYIEATLVAIEDSVKKIASIKV